MKSEALQKVGALAQLLVSHASSKKNFSYIGCTDTNSYLDALSRDNYSQSGTCGPLGNASSYLKAIKRSLESLQIY